MRIHNLFSRALCVKVTVWLGLVSQCPTLFQMPLLFWIVQVIEHSLLFLLCQFILTGSIYHWLYAC